MVLWLRHRRLLWSILAALATLLLTLLLTGRQTRPTAVGGEISSPGTVIVLDAGHGGEDGGAVSPDGVPESGINLQIVRKAEGLLVFLGRSVRLTRTGEEAIYSPEAQTLREKKVSDLKNRVALINALPHAVLLSIHQNSMPQHPAVHGAQVFSNPGACRRAGAIHPAGAESDSKHRNEKTAKAIGDSVYLMKHITCPGVLVECGFLSNSHEAQLLRQPEQQKRLAAAIVAGYLNFGNH
ncbi:MAG: N-acetylmuramoyl-L-alanine amidase [Oscillospiraceae bacterium]